VAYFQENKTLNLYDIKEKKVIYYAIFVFFALVLAIGAKFSNFLILVLILYICMWSVFNLPLALFILTALIIADGSKVAFIMTTSGGQFIESIGLLPLYCPFFLLSIIIFRVFRSEKIEIALIHVKECRWAIFFFVLWVFLTLLPFNLTLKGCLQFVHTFIFFVYLILLSMLEKNEIIFILKSLVFWGFVYTIFGILSISGIVLIFDPIKVMEGLKLNLIFLDGKIRAAPMTAPAVAASFYGLSIWSTVFLGVYYPRFRKALFTTAIFILSGLILTRTRSEIVSFLSAGLLFTAVITFRNKFVIRGLTLFLALFITVFIVANVANLAGGLRRFAIATDISKQASLSTRLSAWKNGIIELAEEKGLGVGAGNSVRYTKMPHAHNVYFSILFDLGIPGLFFWLLAYFNIWRLLLFGLKNLASFSADWYLILILMAYFFELSLTSLLQFRYIHFMWWLFPGLILASLNNLLPVCSPGFHTQKFTNSVSLTLENG
jgi:O-antigen ligase